MRALYAGTFDPFTLGHLDIALRAANIFDEVVVGIAFNSEKKAIDCISRREIARLSVEGANNIAVEGYEGLTTDFALKSGCGVIVRGVRNILDYENEKSLANVYKQLLGIDTVFLFASPENEHISSSLVKELILFGKDFGNYVAPAVKELILKLYKKT